MVTLLPISQSWPMATPRRDHAARADAGAVADFGAGADHHAVAQHHVRAQAARTDRSASACGHTASDAVGIEQRRDGGEGVIDAGAGDAASCRAAASAVVILGGTRQKPAPERAEGVLARCAAPEKKLKCCGPAPSRLARSKICASRPQPARQSPAFAQISASVNGPRLS